MHYLVEFKTERLAMEDVEDRGDVYFSPEGDRAWAFLEARDEETLRQGLEDQEVEEIQPVLPAREYAAISRAREDLESQKARFVDDPSGALAEARRSVGQALEARGYPTSERADEAPQGRGEILRASPPITEVDIDIKPGSDPNSINLNSAGVVPVAILSSDTFDATTVDPDTVNLAGARVKMVGKSGKYLAHEEDVNGDGMIDLVCHIYTAEFMIEVGESVAVLEGDTYDGTPVRGEDSVRIVPDN